MRMSDIISQHWAKECQQSGHPMILKCMAEGCEWGGAYFYTTHAEHLADELAKAGFGSTRDAKAKALRDAADDLTRLSYIKPGDPGRDEYERTLAVRRGNTDNWLRARAEALTKGTA